MSIADKYKIIDKLGNQKVRKFGQSYLVEEVSTGIVFVMKVVKKSAKNRHIVDRLKQEAKFHFLEKGLPDVRETFESDTEFILIRIYRSGVSLEEYWSGLKRKDRLHFLKHLISELHVIFNHLAERKIVHCDIKPSNILVSETQEITLIDFGLAINQNDIEDREILFPLGFAAPELLLNRLQLVNQSSDIYALGILIWRLYAGKLPLTHPNPSIFTNLQLTHPLPYDSAIPKAIFPILEKMTNKHQFELPPNKMKQEDVDAHLQKAIALRYKNLIEVLNDLEKINQRRSFLPKNIFSKS